MRITTSSSIKKMLLLFLLLAGLYYAKEFFSTIENNYSLALSDLYRDPQTAFLEDIDLTTIINFNRELLSSNKAMILAVKELLLNEKQNLAFNESRTI